MAKILIVEDDTELAKSIADWLTLENHTVEHAETGEDGLQLVNGYQYDLLILDWQLPGISGVDVCKQYRRGGGEMPVLFLTGKSGADAIETGLDAGADDYLVKPFQVRELSARIRSLMRRPKGLLPTKLKVDYLSVELETRTAIVNNDRVVLSPKEFALLEFLFRHPNRCYGAKALLEAIWPSETESSEDTVRTIMKNLRRKITPAGSECVIKTVQGSGYIIEQAVTTES